MKTYIQKDIDAICEEIELQWDYHLLCRSIFCSGAGTKSYAYSPPPYYQKKGISFFVAWPNPLPDKMNISFNGINAWLNQNYIIRLYGILDGKQVIKMGKKEKNPYTEILALLRNMVGAHSAGYKNPKRSESKKVSELIYKNLDQRELSKDIEKYNLSIDTVLEPLKNHCIRFVKSLIGKSLPEKSEKNCCVKLGITS